MNPAIPDGAILEIEPILFEHAGFGDVVMASYGPSWYVIHRVVGRDRSADTLLTKGDSLDAVDPRVDRAAFLGRVAGYVVGRRQVWLKRGLMRGAGPLLSVFSLASMGVASPLCRMLTRTRGGVRVARLIARASRVPGWVVAWCLVFLSQRPCEPRSNGQDRGPSDGHCPEEATAP
ncbi:S24/S26 family peptidase [Candidatus Fermentibacteria bacterium]|nr:S24/S26 family peptidase [Candidatus Fermentibacteria bacterium]